MKNMCKNYIHFLLIICGFTLFSAPVYASVTISGIDTTTVQYYDGMPTPGEDEAQFSLANDESGILTVTDLVIDTISLEYDEISNGDEEWTCHAVTTSPQPYIRQQVTCVPNTTITLNPGETLSNVLAIAFNYEDFSGITQGPHEDGLHLSATMHGTAFTTSSQELEDMEWNLTVPLIKTIPECECYEVGSEESAHPDTTLFLYSNNNGVSWDYVPVPDSEGKDCSVTELKMILREDITKKEDLENEFVGTLTNTRVVNDGNGMVTLDYLPGTMRAHTFGGNGYDSGSFIATDNDGNIFITGFFEDTVDFDSGSGIDNHTSNGGLDVFLTKYNADGSYAWTKTFGGTGWDDADSLTFDTNGNIFVVGRFSGTVDFNAGNGSDERTAHGSSDAYLTKYNADGSYAWTRVIGLCDENNGEDCGEEFAGHIEIDSHSDVIITGTFNTVVNFDDTGGIDEHMATGFTSGGVGWTGNSDIFITKYRTNGSYVWTKTFGGNEEETPDSLAIDGNDNVLLTGYFEGTANFDDNGTDEYTSNGQDDIFLTKYNANGTYAWTKVIGGIGQDHGFGNTVNSNNDIFITGSFSDSVNFNTDGGVDVHDSADGGGFLTKYNANGTYAWTKTFDGGGNGVTVDSVGNLYVSGRPSLVKYNADGSHAWTRLFDGEDFAIKSWVHNDKVFVTGFYSGTVNFDATGGTDEYTSNGGNDVFFTAYNLDGTYDPLRYSSNGEYKTIINTSGFIKKWDDLNITAESDVNTTLKTEILDKNCTTTLIPATTDRNIDLSDISTSNTKICLKFIFQTTDNQITPKLDKWEATYTIQSNNTENNFTYKTKPDSSCNTPIDPKNPEKNIDKCKTINIKNITENSVDLRVEVDKSYNDKQKFKVEAKNLDNNTKEIIKLKETPSDNAKVTLHIDRLNEGTNYEFKVSHDEEGSYEYCPHKKQAHTKQILVGPPVPVLPVCGSNKKTFAITDDHFDGEFCEKGKSYDTPDFPRPGEKVHWTCASNNEKVSCSASRKQQQSITTPPHVQAGTNPVMPHKKQKKQKTQEMKSQMFIPQTIGLGALAVASMPLVPFNLQTSFITLFAIPFFKRKPKKYWGTIFDKDTKQPQKNVIVSLVDAKTNEKIDSMMTDDTGRYGFLISKESQYALQVKKGHYTPFTQKDIDPIYGKIYTHPQDFKPETPIELNIALEQDKINWKKYTNNIATRIVIKKIVNILMYILFSMGAIFSIVVTFFYPYWYNYAVLIFYALSIIYLITTFVTKHYGTVTNRQTKTPIPFTLIELFKNNKREYFTVSDIQGRYYLLAKNGKYTMKVKGQPVGGHIFEQHDTVIVDEGMVKKDIVV